MLKIDEFFDLSQTAFAQYFDGLRYPWDILKSLPEIAASFDQYLIKGDVMDGAHILGADIAVGPGTVVEPGAVIKGPTVIGANCEIRAGAYIRGNTIIGDGGIVGNSSEVKNALFLEGAAAPHFNYVGDSVLGRKCNLGAGVKLSNWKIAADKNVTLRIDDETVDTGLQKFGAVLGDFVEIGCNSVLNPGTVVGANTLIYAVSNVRGYIPGDSIVKLKQTQQVVEKRP
ncbi:MAG: glucose-1-phosphate thymidylyltransferase [bacterium]|nr:glucose-1-phosphate thymidylyltransferase [bacterium]